MFDYLLIYAIKQLKSQRSTASVFHIFSGRRSAQTIQDAHFYQLTHLYSIYQRLHRQEFEQSITKLVKQNYLQIDEQEKARLTEAGEAYLITHKHDYPTDSFKGIDYADKITQFTDRLLLTIQTHTNLSMSYNQFQPIIEDVKDQNWVKQHYQQNKDSCRWLLTVFSILKQFLLTIDTMQAELFVERLTGYRKYGSTLQQLALKYNRSIHDIYLLLTVTYHQLVDFIEVDQINTLVAFIPTQEQQFKTFATQSAAKTYQFISKKYSIEKIMQLRRLKRSTIEDHIVELTYAIPEFNLSPYIDQTMLAELINKIKPMDDHRLTKIKSRLDDHYSYFQIRLAMAKMRIKKN